MNAQTALQQTSRIGGERWFSVAEIADHLGVKRDTVYKWIDRKQMPAHKVGRLWKFKVSEIDNWVLSGKAEMEVF